MKILFACIENSCRSQIAEALAKNISQGKIEFYSAGSKPSGVVNPMAIKYFVHKGFIYQIINQNTFLILKV